VDLSIVFCKRLPEGTDLHPRFGVEDGPRYGALSPRARMADDDDGALMEPQELTWKLQTRDIKPMFSEVLRDIPNLYQFLGCP